MSKINNLKNESFSIDNMGQKRRIYPPHAVIISILSIFLLNITTFLEFLSVSTNLLSFLGAALTFLGMLLLYSSAILFRKAETELTPFKESTTLITWGPFRYSRNPIYLGMIFILLGICIALNNLIVFIIPVVFAFWIHFSFILKEEIMMKEVYGSTYTEYASKVRRWF